MGYHPLHSKSDGLTPNLVCNPLKQVRMSAIAAIVFKLPDSLCRIRENLQHGPYGGKVDQHEDSIDFSTKDCLDWPGQREKGTECEWWT